MCQVSRQLITRGLVALITLSLAGCGLSPVPLEERQGQGTQTTEGQETSPEPEVERIPAPDVEAEDVPVPEDATDAYFEPTLAGEGYGYERMYGEEVTYDTEEYAALEESGFVATLTSPLSTVSADVDTASYANLRRMLRDGYALPDEGDREGEPSLEEDVWEDEWRVGSGKTIPKGAVRIEEMINYFDYAYDVPEAESFAITARVGTCPWNRDTELLVLGFRTPPEDIAIEDAGRNLVFLVDVSGSMDEPDKLPLLVGSFAELVGELGERDRVSIVTYAGGERVVMEGESGANHTEIMRCMRSLKAEGATNGEAGLKMAYDVCERYRIEGGVNRIIMASDGDLNVGMTSQSDLHDFVEQKRATGIYLSVLGFGAGNYKDTKMETLADCGNGSYHYIDCEEEAKRVFGERLCQNLVPFANDVKLQVEFNPAQVKAYRLIGYENRRMAAEDFKDDTKDAGEVGPDSRFTVAYEIVRTDSPIEVSTPELKYGSGAANISDEWLTATLRWQPLDATQAREVERIVTPGDWSADPGEDWRFCAAVIEFGMLLRSSAYRGDTSFESIRALAGTPADATRSGLLELVDLAERAGRS